MSNSRYILAKPIARGGMAEIFLAKSVGDDNFQRIVVAKRILNHYAKDKDFVEMFRDEAHVGKKLQHANIVQVYDFEEVDNSYAIIMEFVNGADFRSVLAAAELNRMRIPVPMAISIVAMAARGLHYAHTKMDDITGQPLGVVHRDISPQNILVSFQGEVKVIDFGIADADGKKAETQPGVVKGKYAYMSPEQISGKHVDARTDVFALCVMLWEALAMKRLFNGINEVETIKMVQSVKVAEDLSALNTKVTNELKAIVMKGLHKDPKKRFQSAGKLENALLKYLNARYPEYNPKYISKFMAKILADKKSTAQDNIKDLLTSTNQKTANPSNINSSINLDPAPGLILKFNAEKTNASLTIDKSNLAQQHSLQNKILHTTLKPSKYANVSRVPASSVRLKRRRQTAQLRRKSPNYILKLAMMLAIVFIGYLGYQKYGNKYIKNIIPTQSLSLNISTNPSRVRIKIDDIAINNGNYLATPVTQEVPKKSNIIQIERAGFLPQKIKLDSSKKNYRVSLKKDPNVRYSYLRIESKNHLVNFSINGDFVSGSTPVLLNTLPADNKYIFKGELELGEENIEFKCSFNLKQSTRQSPSKLILDTTNPRKTRCILKSPKNFRISH